MKKLKNIAIAFVLILIGSPLNLIWAQAQIQSEISSHQILIGDQISVTYLLSQLGPNAHVIWPLFNDSVQGLDWVEIKKIDTLTQNDSVQYRQQLIITSFDSGTYVLPSFPIQIIRDSDTQSIATDSFVIHVQTVDVDTTQAIKSIEDIYEVPYSWKEYLPKILLGLFAFALIAFGIFYWIKKYRKRKTVVEEKITPEKAHERALRLLSDLTTQSLESQISVKEYYARLSVILREYLENRFEVQALELTTQDLLKAAKKDRNLRSIRPELKRILQTADLAKYAKMEPTAQEQEICMEQTVSIVQKTKFTEGEAGQS